ncbi:hypothetical protein EMCRGX_G019636 [Ephydatia muelleri]
MTCSSFYPLVVESLSVLPFAFDDLFQHDGSIVVVVSPLIALMKDQVAALNAKGVPAAYLSSDMKDHGQQERILRGQVKILYIGPELLMLPQWREMLRTPVYKENLVAYVIDKVHCVTNWGDSFRREFKKLGAVRSLIPSHVHMMALTATATVSTRDTVISILGMKSPTIVSASPDKPNISYTVRDKGNIEETFSPLQQKLQSLRCQMPRVIIYCRKEECSQLYLFFLSLMKHEFTEPPRAPNIAMFRLVDMYTSVTRKNVQESIISFLTKSDAPLRIVICTIAFGMGIDCADVCQIIHWGAPSDIESYVQDRTLHKEARRLDKCKVPARMTDNGSACGLSDSEIQIISLTYTGLSFLSLIVGLIALLLNRYYYYRYKERQQIDPMEDIFFTLLAICCIYEFFDCFQWFALLDNFVGCSVLGAVREYTLISLLVIIVCLGTHLLIVITQPKCLQVINEVKLKRYKLIQRIYVTASFLVPAIFVPWPFLSVSYGKQGPDPTPPDPAAPDPAPPDPAGPDPAPPDPAGPDPAPPDPAGPDPAPPDPAALTPPHPTLQALTPPHPTLQALTPPHPTLQPLTPPHPTLQALTPPHPTLQALTPPHPTLQP